VNRRSLRFRITRWYAGMLAVSILLFGATAYFGLQSYLKLTLRDSLRADARAIGERILEDAAARGVSFVVGEINEGYAPSSNGLFIRVTRGDGFLMYRSGEPTSHEFNPASVAPAEQVLRASSQCEEARAGAKPLMVCAFPYTTHDGTHYLIEAGSTYSQIQQTMYGLGLIFLIGGPLIVLLAFAGGYVVMGRALAPVHAIIERTEQISWQEPNQRLPVFQTGDELDQLACALNRMLDRMERAFQHIRRFSADVSHELRTPLAIIRGELESIVGEHDSSPQVLDTLGSALEEAERLSRIVEQLLVLSRLDVGDESVRDEIVDFGPLAKNTAEHMRLLCDEKQITIECDLGSGVFVRGSTSRLKQVVVNLLDNAIKYSKVGGRIGLLVAARDRVGVLEVRDDGVGIPARALPHVFERFYRADKARSRETGGAGLGLSIVQAIAKAHGGTVRLWSEEGAGTRVTFEIPLAAQETRPGERERDRVTDSEGLPKPA
jgi:heavy metal sensor kinase